MPKTLLAVDDSATMRKVFEITFSGEDFRVLTADGAQKALAHMSEEPIAAVIDTSLEGDDGYAIAKEIRARDARIAIVMTASRYNPYDANRGKASGADDSIDKPFDTQALIEKVKKAMLAHEGAGAAAGQAAPAFQPPAAAAAPAVVAPFSASPRPPVAAAGARPNFPTQRTHTLTFEGGAPAAPPPAVVPGVPPMSSPISRTAPSGVPVFQPPAQGPAAAAPASIPTAVNAPRPGSGSSPTMASPVVGVGTAVNGQLAGKLGELGLSPAQIEGVLALSREVVERVVWEVVPQLAETIIQEEIARLTRE